MSAVCIMYLISFIADCMMLNSFLSLHTATQLTAEIRNNCLIDEKYYVLYLQLLDLIVLLFEILISDHYFKIIYNGLQSNISV
jgi:hypothetical protein